MINASWHRKCRSTGHTMIATPKKSLGAIRRKPVDLAQFNPIKESLIDGRSLPLVIEPASDQVDLADWIANNRDHVEERMGKHGGILFRNFGLKGAEDFERVASTLCGELYSE